MTRASSHLRASGSRRRRPACTPALIYKRDGEHPDYSRRVAREPAGGKVNAELDARKTDEPRHARGRGPEGDAYAETWFARGQQCGHAAEKAARQGGVTARTAVGRG